MNDKLKDVRGRKPTEDDVSLHHEGEGESDAQRLEPDPETVVPTGDEDAPVSSDPMEARKALYKKAREHRQDTISKDRGEQTDAELIERMVAEASGGESDGAEALDTNRRDRHSEDDEQDEARALAERMEKEKDKPESTNKDSGSEPDALTPKDPDAKVQVKIQGKEYTVPQQDVDDAGGIEAYQKSRAATLRLQRIATLEKALTAKPEASDQPETQQADPSSDGLDEADISTIREKVLEAMVNGEDMEAVDKVLEEALSSGRKSKPKSTPKPEQPRSEVGETERAIIREAQEELNRMYEEDRVATNEMMRREYSDIMGDPDLMALAQQRFAMLSANPDNAGRTQKELARESAEHIRSIGKRLLVERPVRNEMEEERRRRITKKRSLPQTSRADTSAPARKTTERKVPSRKEYLQELRRRAGLEPPA